jgi:hypothetical protein
VARQASVTFRARARAWPTVRTRDGTACAWRARQLPRGGALLCLLSLAFVLGRARAQEGGKGEPASEAAPAAADEAGGPAPETPVYPPGYVPSEQAAQDLGEYPPPSMYAVPPLPDQSSSLEGVAGAREHDGFFLRMSLGPGAGRTRYEESFDGVRVSEVDASGLSGLLDIGVGGRLVGNLILHGDLIFSRFYSATRMVDDVKDATVSVSASATLVGAGVSYYFMPLNMYLTSTLGLGWLFERREGDELRSGTGFSLAVAAGKEWWVGRSGTWGVGAAVHGTFAIAPVDIAGVESKMKAGNIAAVFSATYN